MTKKSPPARGRPRGFDADQAVATARALFHERGYDQVGIAELSDALGIKPPSLYAAFGSKAGLFERVLDDYLAGDGGFVRTALAGEGTPRELLERLLNATATHCASGGSGCLVTLHGQQGVSEEARALSSARGAETRQRIVDRFAPFVGARAEELADQLMVALAGMSAAARMGVGGDALLAFGAMTADALADRFGLGEA